MARPSASICAAIREVRSPGVPTGWHVRADWHTALWIIQAYFSAPSLPAADAEAEQMPLFWGWVDAMVAGVSEGSSYRGYSLEELGSLLSNGTAAAAVGAASA